MSDCNPDYIEWCKKLFAHLEDGEDWSIDRSGLHFRKRGNEIVLENGDSELGSDPMIVGNELLDLQRREFTGIKEHFAAAGITVHSEWDKIRV